MYLYGHKIQTITMQGKFVDQLSCKRSYSRIFNVFRKWLKARNGQHSARKEWSEHIAECCLNKLDLNREKNYFHL